MNAEQKERVRERAREAIRDLYHNATIVYPRHLYGRSEADAQDWLGFAVQDAIEHIATGGAYGTNYAATLRAPCNAGRYKSERAREYYVRAKLRAMRMERATYAPWERITEYGRLYQYGRGGRTLAPCQLIREGGGSSFRVNEDWPDDRSIADCAELILIVESFNRYCAAWCASVPSQWQERCEEEDAEILRQKRIDAARKAKETRERNFWAARDVQTI